MTTVLGIDAAWTKTQPSGVALVSLTRQGWQSIAVAPSYTDFMGLAGNKNIDWDKKSIKGSCPDMASLLGAAAEISGERVKIIAIDMPVSLTPFKTRRVADNKISKEFGSRWCAAHSPTAIRPGDLGRNISTALVASGFKLAVDNSIAKTSPCLLEVYPHVALLSMLKRERRVPYKVSKSTKYWPGTDINQRKENLLSELQAIHDRLTSSFGDLGFVLPAPDHLGSLSVLKRYEDALDALICAWVGVQFFEGKVIPLGDSRSAIWCPRDVVDA